MIQLFLYRGSMWLFVNKTKKNLSDLNEKLYLYKLSNNLSKLTPHKLNPIKKSKFGGRSAGYIFKMSKKNSKTCPNSKKITMVMDCVFFK